MNFGWKRRKLLFFNCIFGLSPYMFTQILSVDTLDVELISMSNKHSSGILLRRHTLINIEDTCILNIYQCGSS